MELVGNPGKAQTDRLGDNGRCRRHFRGNPAPESKVREARLIVSTAAWHSAKRALDWDLEGVRVLMSST